MLFATLPVAGLLGVPSLRGSTSGNHPRGNWKLKLKVNGQQKKETKPISTKTCPVGWLLVEYDLSEWTGQTVKLELLNEASGWYCEAGYWSEIKIDIED